jgi:hypothetical protein
MYMAVAAFVIWTVLTGADTFRLAIAVVAAMIVSFVVLIDYHWSTVIRFYAKHPTIRTEKIKWLESDSEPDFAFQREKDAKIFENPLTKEEKEQQL